MNHPDTMLVLAHQRQRELHAEAHTARLARDARRQRSVENGRASGTAFRRRVTIGAAAMVVTFGVLIAAALAAI